MRAATLPLYRQSRMLARQGITLDRPTLGNWVGRACLWLTKLYDLVVSAVLGSTRIFADDTTLSVLDPGRGRRKLERLWCCAVNDRPWCGPDHPAAAYIYAADRKNERPARHQSGFRGVLQVDGHDGFKRLAENRVDGAVCLAFWLSGVLERIVSGRTKTHELHTLLPWSWRPGGHAPASIAA